MIDVGNKPILWHIMKIYSSYGINDFIICAGYKGFLIKEYFANYFLHQSNITFDMTNNDMEVHHNGCEPWKVTIVDTGEHTMTGGRLKRIQDFVGDEPFCMTYGDGVSNVNIEELIKHHKDSGKLATLTAVCPPKRFGVLNLNDNAEVVGFMEKPVDEKRGWINGGFFVLNPQVLNLIEDDQTVWEREPLETLAAAGQLNAFRHNGFWHPMDTLKDKLDLEKMWKENNAPWNVWDETDSSKKIEKIKADIYQSKYLNQKYKAALTK